MTVRVHTLALFLIPAFMMLDSCASQALQDIAHSPSVGATPVEPAGAAHVNFLALDQGASVASQHGFGSNPRGILVGDPRYTTTPTPVHMVFDLGQEREIGTIIFNNSEDRIPGASRDDLVRQIEVHASNDSATDGFRTLGAWQLERRDGQKVTFTPTRARYVRVVVTQNYGGKATVLKPLSLHPPR
jgi:hypothetical protein